MPHREPTSIIAGDTLQWALSLPDFPVSDGWQLSYRLLGDGIDAAVVADTSTGGFVVTFASGDTARAVKDGTARLTGWVSLSGVVITIHDAAVAVRGNLRSAAAASVLSHDERVLQALEATLEGRATSDIQQYTIKGRMVTKMAAAELLTWIGIYRGRVWRRQNPGVSFPKHQVRFVGQ